MTRNELAIFVVLAAGATVAGCGRSAAPVKGAPAEGGKKVLYWVDPMHPAYKSDRPGKAPDCGMDLVPVYATEAPRQAAAPPAPKAAPGATVELTPEAVRAAEVATSPVQVAALRRTVRAVGTLLTDET